jgi:copper chaperone NosL
LAEQYGGRVLRFEQIDQALLQQAAGQQQYGTPGTAPAPDEHPAAH